MAVYEIKPNPDFSTSFMLYLFPTEIEMRKEARRRMKRNGCTNPDDDDFAGMFIPSVYVTNTKHKGNFHSDMFGYMFLAEETIGVGYVAHECLHAAMAYERYRLRFSMDYSDDQKKGTDDHEERLAYYHEDCIDKVWKVLVDNRHVKTLKGSTKWLRH